MDIRLRVLTPRAIPGAFVVSPRVDSVRGAPKQHCLVLDAVRCCIMHSRDVIKALRADGWCEVRVSGSHHHFRHPDKPGTVTVPHPVRDLRVGTLKSIERQSGNRF